MAKFLSEEGLRYFYNQIKSKFAAASHNHSAGNITSGTLPIARGGTGASDVANARTNLGIDTLAFNPIGSIIAFGGNTIPNGYLLCDGSNISRTTYKDLFDVIGTTYGTGDGSTTFTLPNLIDRFIEGSSVAGKYIQEGLPNITGNFYSLLNGGANDGKGSFYAEKLERSFDGKYSETVNCWWLRLYFDASHSSSIYGSSNVVQPAAMCIQYLIRY